MGLHLLLPQGFIAQIQQSAGKSDTKQDDDLCLHVVYSNSKPTICTSQQTRQHFSSLLFSNFARIVASVFCSQQSSTSWGHLLV